MLDITGVGEKKCRQYGKTILAAISKYSQTHALDTDR
ncbi:MAG: hypothetical protein ACYTAS_22760 [Planctomycetota bacterium]